MRRQRIAGVAGLLICAASWLAACGSDSAQTLVTCDNGIIVFAEVPCETVVFDADRLDAETTATIDALRTEAEADPTRAVANAQTIQRLIAAQPFQVCEALQNDPDDDFVNSETIAPIAQRYAATICPDLDTIDELRSS